VNLAASGGGLPKRTARSRAPERTNDAEHQEHAEGCAMSARLILMPALDTRPPARGFASKAEAPEWWHTPLAPRRGPGPILATPMDKILKEGRRPVPGTTGFRDWLRERENLNDPIGDLARSLAVDDQAPAVVTELLLYLEEKGGRPLLKLCEAAVEMWRAQT